MAAPRLVAPDAAARRRPRCRCFRSSGAPVTIRDRLIVSLRIPMSARTTSSARPPTARRCSPARSRASVRATARRSRTRSCALPTSPRTRSSSSPRASTTHEVYPNGISTSLPFDVQYEFVRSIRGFEHAHLTRPGYAIEYDFFDPRDLQHSLETRAARRAVLRRPDQRHHRLRGGRRAGPRRRHQRRAARCAAASPGSPAQRGLPRRAHR